jgi:transposase
MEKGQSAAVSGFSRQDRRHLTQALGEVREVRLLLRVQTVLRGAEGCSASEAARQAGVDRTSVHRWIDLYRREPRVEDLAAAARSGRPREADDWDQEFLAEILSQDPRPLGFRATTWTVPLLRTHLGEDCGCPVSERTVRRRWHEFDYSWKRPHTVYHERDPHVAQKKGRFTAA